jgi:pre-mRNA-processing factor 8
MLIIQARKWQSMNTKRYATTRKFGYVQAPKEEMPPGKLNFPE